MLRPKKIMPKQWPKDLAIDTGYCSWLPSGWTKAIKKTSSGLLIVMYVGPPPTRQRFFHKASVEKYVGKKLPCAKRRPYPRGFSKHLQKQFPPEAFLQRTDESANDSPNSVRCDKIHGMKVKDALMSFSWKDSKGKNKDYTMGDLQYDFFTRRLKMSSRKPRGKPASAKAKTKKISGLKKKCSAPLAKTKIKRLRKRIASIAKRRRGKTLATESYSQSSSSSRSPSSTQAKSQKIRRLRKRIAPIAKRQRGKTSTSYSQSSSSRNRSVVKRSPHVSGTQAQTKKKAKHFRGHHQVSASSSANEQGNPTSTSAETLKHIAETIVAPFKKKAAHGLHDERNVFALLGIGHSHGFDQSLLAALPATLKTPPALRGPVADMVMQQLDVEFAKRGVTVR